jgi:hypothetical protein
MPHLRAATRPGYDADLEHDRRQEERQRKHPSFDFVGILADELGLDRDAAYFYALCLRAAQDTPRQARGPKGYQRIVVANLRPLDILGITRPAPPTLSAGPSAEPTNAERLEASRLTTRALDQLIAKDLVRADDRGWHWIYTAHDAFER